jgi:hypothetical protein
MPKVHNPYGAEVITLNNLCLGTMRVKYKPYSTAEQIHPSLPRRKANNKFRQHSFDPASTKHTLFTAKDGGVIAYHVPAAALTNRPDLIPTISNLPKRHQKQNGAYRGGHVQRHYLIHCASAPQPFESAEFRHDGQPAVDFTHAIEPVWNEASEILRNMFPKVYRDYTQFPLPPRLSRKAGAWCGFAVNIGSEEIPVATEIHRDVGESPHGMSCLTAFGDWRGGKVVFWEAELIIDLQPGDLLFFCDAIYHHSNEAVTGGTRHSVVAYTPRNMQSYWEREHGRDRTTEEKLRARRAMSDKDKKQVARKTKGESQKSQKSKRKADLTRKRHIKMYRT